MPVRAAAREQPHKDHKYRDLFPSVRMRAALLALAVAVAVIVIVSLDGRAQCPPPPRLHPSLFLIGQAGQETGEQEEETGTKVASCNWPAAAGGGGLNCLLLVLIICKGRRIIPWQWHGKGIPGAKGSSHAPRRRAGLLRRRGPRSRGSGRGVLRHYHRGRWLRGARGRVVLCARRIIRVSDYPSGIGYPRILVLEIILIRIGVRSGFGF